MGIFSDRKTINSKTQMPVWFMRQAGRYHDHYQNIKKSSDFMTMCKTPELACEVTMGPLEEFGFDAAILFSDLLFPLEHLGFGLEYSPGPKLSWNLQTIQDLKKLQSSIDAKEFYSFQAKAVELIKKKLTHQTMLGFVGAPFTLYTYAVEGSHSGNLKTSKNGLFNGLFDGFCEILFDSLITEVDLQLNAGCEAICLFDTAAGELSQLDFKNHIKPQMNKITKLIKTKHPDKKVIYFSRNTHLGHLQSLEDKNIDVMALDWKYDLNQAAKELQKDYWLQGNIDPTWLFLPWEQLEKNLSDYHNYLRDSDVDFSKWVFNLGHGVLPQTPQENVFKAVKYIQETFSY